jgi:hypothetical protein
MALDPTCAVVGVHAALHLTLNIRFTYC